MKTLSADLLTGNLDDDTAAGKQARREAGLRIQ